MNRIKRAKIYLIIASTIFFINLFNVDFDNLGWDINRKQYINMIIALIVWLAIFVMVKRNKNS